MMKKWNLGFNKLEDTASLPLILFLYTLYAFLLSPIGNAFSRGVEHNADTFGLELTHLNEGAATGFVKLAYNNLGYPWPGTFYLLFRSTHPPIGDRITYFNEYKPWCEGASGKYEIFFH